MYPRPNRTGKKRRIALIIAAAVVVVVAAVVVTALWVPGFARSTNLDVHAAQDGVRKVLTDPVNGYGAQKVTDVVCNDGANPTVENGATFTCVVTINGNKHQVTATFIDDSGTYIVGRPH